MRTTNLGIIYLSSPKMGMLCTLPLLAVTASKKSGIALDIVVKSSLPILFWTEYLIFNVGSILRWGDLLASNKAPFSCCHAFTLGNKRKLRQPCIHDEVT